jgi:hypothetical protein
VAGGLLRRDVRRGRGRRVQAGRGRTTRERHVQRQAGQQGPPGQSRGASHNAFSASEPETPGAYRAAARPAADTFKAPPAAPADDDEAEESAARPGVAPAVFSHPAAETVADNDDRRRRSAPPQTPFST